MKPLIGSVTAELSVEVCGEFGEEGGFSKTQVIKIPGRKGKITVGCAKGMQAKFAEEQEFVSYRAGSFTWCFASCPEPRCMLSPTEVGSKLKESGADNDDEPQPSTRTCPTLVPNTAVLALLLFTSV